MAKAGGKGVRKGVRKGAGRGAHDAGIVAERLHRAAIQLLRRLRIADDETGLSAPKLSALSVLVFAGAMSLKALAGAEQVTAATMSRLISDLAEDGLVSKTTDPADARGLTIAATAKGRTLMMEGRARRLKLLRAQLADMSGADLAVLDEAAALILRAAGD